MAEVQVTGTPATGKPGGTADLVRQGSPVPEAEPSGHFDEEAERSDAEDAVPPPEEPIARSQQDMDLKGKDITPLFPANDCKSLEKEWDAIQASFVDDPRLAVEKADNLVATTMKNLAKIFADQRSALDSQWNRGSDISTEDLRLALQRYRSFFHRLLSI